MLVEMLNKLAIGMMDGISRLFLEDLLEKRVIF